MKNKRSSLRATERSDLLLRMPFVRHTNWDYSLYNREGQAPPKKSGQALLRYSQRVTASGGTEHGSFLRCMRGDCSSLTVEKKLNRCAPFRLSLRGTKQSPGLWMEQAKQPDGGGDCFASLAKTL
jgi:hypothetical protein